MKSLFTLKLKIITGYVTLVSLFIVLLVLTYWENSKLSATDKYSETILSQQEQAESIVVHIFDIELLSERAIVWREGDVAIYREKLDKVVTSLKSLKNQLPAGNQCRRINSILSLLSLKERQIFAIINNFQELRMSEELLNKRLPKIIQQTKQDRQHLKTEIEHNYEKSEKTSRGIFSIFHSKEKSRYKVKQENETILQKNQTQDSILFRSLANEIRQTRDGKSQRLLVHMDSLNRQNLYLDNEISRLITDFNIEEQNQRRQKAETYLMGQERSFQTVAGLGLCAMLMAIVFYIILHRDLKNRYRYRQQLEELNLQNEDLLRSRKNMMLMVSHDLRAPLSSIRGCAELIIGERYKDKRNHFCETILQSSGRMIDMLNALLSFYRLDTGKEQQDVMPFRLKSLAEMLESEFRPLAQKTGLGFLVSYEGEDVVVSGDRKRLMQIGSNLLSNAFKFTNEGEITLKLSYKDEILRMEVFDTGVGMSQQQVDRIFLPFERLENAEAHEGFGLGLSITLGLIGLLNGKIGVQSEPTKGSAFVVTMPLALTNEQSLKKLSAQLVDIPEGIRVLAIDDDAVLLKMTRDMLSRYQIICDTCQHVQELTELMRKYPYDLLITDIRMPNINGYELLELLRASDIGTSRTIPVLALTARAEYKEEKFIDAGFASCLYKPFSIKELLLTVQRCVKVQTESKVLQADFSKLLSGENNGKDMLELLIHETEKNIHTLIRYLESGDRESIILMVHHLLPLWEIVRMDLPLNNLKNKFAEEAGVTDNVRTAINKVVETGERIMIQAAEQITREKNE